MRNSVLPVEVEFPSLLLKIWPRLSPVNVFIINTADFVESTVVLPRYTLQKSPVIRHVTQVVRRNCIRIAHAH